VTQQQGDTDRLNYAAQQQAKQVGDAAIQSQEAQLLVLRQQKAYQRVVAPFDGVVTRRNIDVGSLVQADATSGTFMFTLTQSDVMRIRLYVPQDAAIGVKPGVDTVVRGPEMPDRRFTGKVTRIADALDPATPDPDADRIQLLQPWDPGSLSDVSPSPAWAFAPCCRNDCGNLQCRRHLRRHSLDDARET